MDNQNMPAKIFDVAAFDPAEKYPGAPPFFGQDIVPHTYTSMGRHGLTSQAYLSIDEATLNSVANAERMRKDCGIMESLEGRQRSTALLNWHIEPEDGKSYDQKILAQELTKILNRTSRFTEMRRFLLEAVWYGRYAAAINYGTDWIGGKRRIFAQRIEPRHGDKLVFRYDDGTHQYRAGQVGIRVGGQYRLVNRLRDGETSQQVQYTEHGMVYWLNSRERKTLVLHKHHIEDAPFHEPRMMGRIHGVGVRDRIYWTWYAMTECLQRVLEYLDRSAMGVEIWRFPAGNSIAENRVRQAAKEYISGGRSVVLCPVYAGEQSDMFGVEHIEPGMAGVDSMLTVIKEFFGHKIKRYILGQTLTSEADATGLGSGVADAHLATFADIVQYDAINLEETLTQDFLRPIQLWNFPRSANCYMRFKIDTESEDADKKMQGFKSAWDMGMRIKASDVADVIGISMATGDEDQLFNPQVATAIEQSKRGKSLKDQVLESYYRSQGMVSQAG
ncbi:MAG: DUF935 family protein [Pirellulaceae bacterium]|nr:DUF935 family protein [Pirellulaceae bacterium]